jgi:carboxyl-terminal processing protease
MTFPCRTVVWCVLAVLTTAVLSRPASVCAEAAPADARVASAALMPDLTRLADTGKFDIILRTLRDDQLLKADVAVARFIDELDRYQTSKAERDASRRDAYTKAHEKMQQRAEAGRLIEAVYAAIDAHGLADDKAALLADDKVVALVRSVIDKAMAAEVEGDWLESLSLWRALNLLFDDTGTYRHNVKVAAKHVRVLRFYAPTEWKRLYEISAARAKAVAAAEAQPDEAKQGDAREQEEVEIAALNEEKWQDRLKGIELAMLRQTLAQAARRHIADRGYAPLMRGSLSALQVLANSRGLETTFPNFADARKLADFRTFVDEQAAKLDAPGAKLNFLDAATLIDQIMLINDKSLQLPEQVIVYEMTEGATDTLDDFSAVIWPDERENFSRNTQGRFFGVGIQISRRDGRLLVVSPLEGTPAQRAGIKAGDIIAKVDGRDTSSWTLDQAVREITGPEGTVVTLGIERVGEAAPLEFPIKRAEIIIESIKGWEHKPGGGWDYYIDRDNKIGYVRLTQFIPQSADDLDAAINAMQADAGIHGLILDLRFNPGGLLTSAIDIADRFVASGPIVFTVDSSGQRTSEARAKRHQTYDSFPVVVLINQGAASASEIVAGALQDYGRARIIGTRSFGKGSVQDLFPIDGGKAYLKLTTQYYKLPLGRIIHRETDSKTWGVEPDLIIEMTNQQVAKAIEFRQDVDVLRDPDAAPVDGKAQAPRAADILTQSLDPQLDTALLVLKTRLVARQIAVAQRDPVQAAQ